MSEHVTPEQTRDAVVAGLGRRGFLLAAAGLGAAAGTGLGAVPASAAPARPPRVQGPRGILQSGVGRIDGDYYLPSETDRVRWATTPRSVPTPP